MKKYSIAILRYFLYYSIGFILFFLFTFLARHVNEFLAGVFPSLFKIYNPVSDREALVSQNLNIALISAIVSVFTLTVITVRQDNARYENIITKTSGFYRIKDGAKLYFSEYAVADALAAITVPTLTAFLVLIKIPNDAAKILRIMADYLNGYLSIPLAFTERCGFTVGLSVLIFTSLVSRIPAAYISLAHWRGIWLSSTER